VQRCFEVHKGVGVVRAVCGDVEHGEATVGGGVLIEKVLE